jgi:glutathione S-transferase
MPYPRRVIIYLREKGIPTSLITIVPVTDPQRGNQVSGPYPPRPSGSLPILAIPKQSRQGDTQAEEYIYIRQSIAIMTYLDELCDSGVNGFPRSAYPMRGADPLERARHNELLSLADELTSMWNPVRTFGSGAGTISLPVAAKEMLRWVYRGLMTIETWFQDRDRNQHEDPSSPATTTTTTKTSIAEIVLYQFLAFTKDCYGIDMTKGSGKEVTDVYGKKVVEDFPRLRLFYETFRARPSARRDPDAGDVPSNEVSAKMTSWAEGVFDDVQ